ncbi:MAG: M67 family metallopeptidase [Candidatus Bathyarchaeia archaeon]
MILRLRSQQLHLLREEARKSHPVEACALLFGRMIDDEAIVTKVVVAPNLLQSTVRFEMDPQIVFNAFEQAEREGLRFIGLFHSHPAPARPSAVDLRYMRLWGEAVWLILSSINGDIAAFQMKNDKVYEITLKIE